MCALGLLTLAACAPCVQPPEGVVDSVVPVGLLILAVDSESDLGALRGTVFRSGDTVEPRALAAASVYRLRAPQTGAATDREGRFMLSDVTEQDTIVAAFVGYCSVRTTVAEARRAGRIAGVCD